MLKRLPKLKRYTSATVDGNIEGINSLTVEVNCLVDISLILYI